MPHGHLQRCHRHPLRGWSHKLQARARASLPTVYCIWAILHRGAQIHTLLLITGPGSELAAMISGPEQKENNQVWQLQESGGEKTASLTMNTSQGQGLKWYRTLACKNSSRGRHKRKQRWQRILRKRYNSADTYVKILFMNKYEHTLNRSRPKRA